MSTTIDTASPRAVAGHIWSATDIDTATVRYGSDTMGDDPNVTVPGLRFEIGDDPTGADCITWCIQGDTFGDGSQWDVLYQGGWETADSDTAAADIANIVRVLNGQPVPEWQRRIVTLVLRRVYNDPDTDELRHEDAAFGHDVTVDLTPETLTKICRDWLDALRDDDVALDAGDYYVEAREPLAGQTLGESEVVKAS